MQRCYRTAGLVLYTLMFFSGCGQEQPQETYEPQSVTIYGGKPGGNYETLINLFNEIPDSNKGQGSSPDAKTPFDMCPGRAISFEAKSSGGSIDNLKSLGMAEKKSSRNLLSEFFERNSRAEKENATHNSFAMVQSNFAYNAAAGTDPRYEPFEDLRIVLPMYHSFIQIVTVTTDPEDVVRDPAHLVEKRVYLGKLGSVNIDHGMAFLDELPQGKSIRFICSDEPNEQFVDCVDRSKINMEWQSTPGIEDILLACEEIDAYVVSGEQKPPKEISCPTDPDTAPKQRVQMAIPADTIDRVIKTKPFYQALAAPRALSGETTPAWLMPAVTTFLMTTSDSDQYVVSRVTERLLCVWSDLKDVAKETERLKIELIDADSSLRRQPVELHPGAEPHIGVTIFGGSDKGAYSQLVKLLNDRLGITKAGCNEATGAEKLSKGCSLPNFDHVPGGSIVNLANLGMKSRESDERDEQSSCLIQTNLADVIKLPDTYWDFGSDQIPINLSSPFALVQNFHVYRAGKGALRDYNSEALKGCYKPFDELRTVLPMYNSYIQVVSAFTIRYDEQRRKFSASRPPDESEPGSATDSYSANKSTEFRSIGDLAGKTIFLGKTNSVNLEYGKDFLFDHPQLQGANKPKYLCSKQVNNNRTLKKVVQLVSCFVNETEEAKSTVLPLDQVWGGDELLACGYIDAYVVSGTLKPFLQLDQCPVEQTRRKAEPGVMIRSQLAIPELIIEEVLRRKDRAYYQILDPPQILDHVPEGLVPVLSKALSSAQTAELDTQHDPSSELRREEEIRQILLDYRINSPMPAVTTYLVTTKAADKKLVNAVTAWLLSEWTSLMLLSKADGDLGFTLPAIDENILRNPVKRHQGTFSALSERDLANNPVVVWQSLAFLLFVGVVLSAAILITPGATFDRMGRRYKKGTLRIWGENVRDAGSSFLLFSLALAVLILAVFFVQWLESLHAVANNQQDRIGNFEFVEALLWMFTFIASGYENDAFPYSDSARIVVVCLAVAGLTLPLWAIIRLVNAIGERRLDRDRGYRDPITQNNHTLICGWNSKGPGLIHTLTCRDSPHRERIVVVAELDEEFPLKKWHFRRKGRKLYPRFRIPFLPRFTIGRWVPKVTGWLYCPIWWSRVRIQYLRGDPAQRNTLERAYIQRADSVIVLLNEAGHAHNDQLSALTVRSVRKLNKGAFIAVELGTSSDPAQYRGRENLQPVDPALISRYMLASACVSEYAVDFAMDALSPDKWSEWYSLEVSKVQHLLPKQACTARDCLEVLHSKGIAMIGVSTGKPLELAGSLSAEFSDVGQLDPLIDEASLDKPLDPKGYIICAARDRNSFSERVHERFSSVSAGVSSLSESILPRSKVSDKILLIGSGERLLQLKEYLGRYLAGCRVEIHDAHDPGTESENPSLKKKLESVEWSHVLIMSASTDFELLNSPAGGVDAQTILFADLVGSVLEKRRCSVRVIAELHDIDNQQLLRDAGVDTVVPVSLLAERFLARLVAGRGYVSTMLLAMMSLENGIYIRSLTLVADHPLVGRRFQDTFMKFFQDGRILAVLPGREDKELVNEENDFGRHFVMCPRDKDVEFEIGDHVIVLVHAKS